MLKQRVITALVVAAFVLVLIFLAPRWLFASAMAALMLIGAWEWSALAGRPGWKSRLCSMALFLALALALEYLVRAFSHVPVLTVINILAILWWLSSLAWIAGSRRILPYALKVACGALTLLPAFTAVVVIRDFNPAYLLVLLLVTSAADIGAYFAGRAFGRRKLAPEVSPGKTWEGVAGGLVLVSAVAAIAAHWLPVPAYSFVFLSICVALLSVVGDLSESLFKRQAGLKDSGRLFPGHGGVLDRVDSLTAAAPLYWLGMHLLGVLP